MDKTCTRCGSYFRPKFSSAKLCFTCWKNRENAFELLAHYQIENAQLKDELAARPMRESSIELRAAHAEIARLQSELMHAKSMAAARAALGMRESSIPKDIAKLLRVLTHPDKHGNSTAATRAFQWVNSTLH